MADARHRVATGAFRNQVRALECRKTPPGSDPRAPGAEADLRARVGAYDCIAVTAFIPNGGDRGALGYPFRLVVDYARFAYVWCKSTPVPGEQVIPDPKSVVLLPRVCPARPARSGRSRELRDPGGCPAARAGSSAPSPPG